MSVWIAVPFAILAVLLMAPTRGVTLGQIRMLGTPPTGIIWVLRSIGVRDDLPVADPSVEQGALDLAARRKPKDFAIQLAYSFVYRDSNPDPGAPGRRLSLLAAQFPDRPELLAAILRAEARDTVQIWRDTEFENTMQGHASRYTAQPDRVASTLDVFKQYENVAIAGQRLAPDNAFFPYMRAVSLFARHADAEALAALKEASLAKSWDSYSWVQEASMWKLCQEAFGTTSEAVHATSYAASVFPHLTQVTNVARMAVLSAVRAELAHHPQEGVAIRHAAMQCGALMRMNAHAALAQLTGINVVELQRLRPGGALVNEDLLSEPQRDQLEHQSYLTWVGRAASPAEREWAGAQFDHDQRARDILSRAQSSGIIGQARTGRALTSLWLLDMTILSNGLALLCLLLFGSVLRSIRMEHDKLRFSQWVEDHSRIEVVGMFIFAVLMAVVLWQAQWAPAFAATRNAIDTLSIQDLDTLGAARFGGATDPLSSVDAIQGLTIIGSLVVPILLLLAYAIARKEPGYIYADSLLSGLMRSGVYITCAVFVAYAGAVVVTFGQERTTGTALEQSIANEGRFAAERLGERWPDR